MRWSCVNLIRGQTKSPQTSGIETTCSRPTTRKPTSRRPPTYIFKMPHPSRRILPSSERILRFTSSNRMMGSPLPWAKRKRPEGGRSSQRNSLGPFYKTVGITVAKTWKLFLLREVLASCVSFPRLKASTPREHSSVLEAKLLLVFTATPLRRCLSPAWRIASVTLLWRAKLVALSPKPTSNRHLRWALELRAKLVSL